MITTEQLECLIPTVNSIKESVLYCTTNATNAAEIWAAVGTFLAVAVSLGLGIFAYLSAKKREIAQAAREIEIRWADYSKEFILALRSVLEKFPDVSNSALLDFTMEFQGYRALAMVHHRPLAELLDELDEVIGESIAAWGKAQSNNVTSTAYPDWPFRQQAVIRIMWQLLSSVAGVLHRWHVDPAHRRECERALRLAIHTTRECLDTSLRKDEVDWKATNPLLNVKFDLEG